MANPRTLEGWVHQALIPEGSAAPGAPARAEQALRSLHALGVRAIAEADSAYPPGLRELPDPPPVLFVRGAALPAVDRAVAIVGARAATPYGAGVAARLAADLARLGMVVVSGLARGIDAAAHRGALEAGGITVAVLPSGLDCVTPPHHRELAEQIASASGTLMTELAAGGPRFKGEFVRRNRLIAGLCAATVVVEAAEGSGALHTAAFARTLGRAVLAVPGDVDRPASRGTHALLREGARVCEDGGDVMRAVGEWRRSHGGSPAICGPEERLLEMLGEEGLLAEDLAARAGLDLPQTLSALLALQWAGLAAPRPGQRWTKAAR
jgi:DNA processing protein